MRQQHSTRIAILMLTVMAFADSAGAYYMPRIGRFLNRDPLPEHGSILVRTMGSVSFVPRDPFEPARASVDPAVAMKADSVLSAAPSYRSIERGRYEKGVARRVMELAEAAPYCALENSPINKVDPLGLVCGCRSCRRWIGWPNVVGHTWIECDDGTRLEHVPFQREKDHTYHNACTSCKDLTFFAGVDFYPAPPVGPPMPKENDCPAFIDCMKRVMGRIRAGWWFPACIGYNCITAKNQALRECALEDGWVDILQPGL